MFRPIESSRPGFNAAQISEGNLCIEWPVGTEPDWNALYMERYRKDFEQARVDYEAYRRLTKGNRHVEIGGVSNVR